MSPSNTGNEIFSRLESAKTENNTLNNLIQVQYMRMKELSAEIYCLNKRIVEMKEKEGEKEENKENEHECDLKDFATQQFGELKKLVIEMGREIKAMKEANSYK